MKKIITLAAILLTTLSVYAQAPGKMSYQAVVRDAANELMVNKEVGIRVSILQGADVKIAVFVENHTSRTNNNGLVGFNTARLPDHG